MGGYELTSFDALHFVNSAKVMTDGGDVGDLNGDGLPDLVLAANNFTFIYWGKSTYPFFRNDNYTILASDLNASSASCAIRSSSSSSNSSGCSSRIVLMIWMPTSP